MFRVYVSIAGRGIPYRYLDSIHAALVAGLTTTGIAPERLLGQSAAPWTFAAKGYARAGGQMVLKGLTISTYDTGIADALQRLQPGNIRCRSTNGDVIELSDAHKKTVLDSIYAGQKEVAVCFASPFLLTKPRVPGTSTKNYIERLQGEDLSSAFSKGLSRRVGRPVALEVGIDPLSLATAGLRPRIVALRQAQGRKVTVPAFSVQLAIRGETEDLRAAYYAGLGEKTRYGFGCVAALS